MIVNKRVVYYIYNIDAGLIVNKIRAEYDTNQNDKKNLHLTTFTTESRYIIISHMYIIPI